MNAPLFPAGQRPADPAAPSSFAERTGVMADAPAPEPMSDEDKETLKRLQGMKSEQDNADSRPNDDNFTHYVHLADGRIAKSRSAAGTVYSENVDDGNGNKVEKFTAITGVHAR
jgi:hypothetical protein